jgi:amino acid adenylation domain-containing protein
MPRLELPFERTNMNPSHAGASHHFTLSTEVTAGLRALAARERCTLFQTLLAAWATLLARYSGQRDLGIATASSTRDRAELRDLFGFFIETIVLRCDLSGEPSFVEVMHRVRDVAIEALDRGGVPFDELVNLVGAVRGRDLTPLVQACFSLEPVPAPSAATPAWTWLEHLRSDSGVEGTAKFNLCLTIVDAPAELRGTLDYATDLFDASTIERMAQHLIALLGEIVREPDRPIAVVPLLSTDERHQIAAWNATAAARTETTVQSVFERQAARTPEAVAVAFEGSRMTYRQLNAYANAIAHALRAAGVGPDVPVGICLHRSLELIVAVLAVLKAGGAYVPFDPAHPEQRLRMALEDVRAPIILTDAALRELLAAAGSTARLLDIGDADWWADQPTGDPLHHVCGDHLAYTIFTSGSTGHPKGAQNTHRGLFNLLSWFQETFPLDGSDAVLLKAPMTFDISAVELLTPLLAGARLIVAAPDGQRDAMYLASLIEAERVTVAHFVPSMLAAFLDAPGVRQCTSLRLLYPGGEALSYELKERCLELLPGCELHNLYGPTEAAVAVSWAPCAAGGSRVVPIGRPIANTRLYVLDEHLACLPVGVPGELYIESVQVARGYLRRPGLTAERFVPSPFGGGARLYRTGDRVRWLPDGNIEYLGRLDFQVKVRGFRIELGEIEAALGELPTVTSAVVVGREDAPGQVRLVAYFTSDADIAIGELRALLKQRLPEYMVPAHYVRLTAFPLTTSGKVDRKALPAPDRAVADDDHAAPRTHLERELAAVFCDVLRVPRVGVTDNFFELGGDSIQVLKFVAGARSRRIVVRPADVFASQTVDALAKLARLETSIELADDAARSQNQGLS